MRSRLRGRRPLAPGDGWRLRHECLGPLDERDRLVAAACRLLDPNHDLVQLGLLLMAFGRAELQRPSRSGRPRPLRPPCAWTGPRTYSRLTMTLATWASAAWTSAFLISSWTWSRSTSSPRSSAQVFSSAGEGLRLAAGRDHRLYLPRAAWCAAWAIWTLVAAAFSLAQIRAVNSRLVGSSTPAGRSDRGPARWRLGQSSPRRPWGPGRPASARRLARRSAAAPRPRRTHAGCADKRRGDQTGRDHRGFHDGHLPECRLHQGSDGSRDRPGCTRPERDPDRRRDQGRRRGRRGLRAARGRQDRDRRPDAPS